MKVRIPILSLASEPIRKGNVLRRYERWSLLVLLVGIGAVSAFAKDASTAAIVLFDGAHGPAYLQLTGVTLNGKTEVRVCDRISSFDKNAYNTLPRVSLAGASSLQRGDDGVLTLTVNGNSMCVIPSNLRFDKKAQLAPAEAAEQAVLQGTPVASSVLSAAMPPLKPGVQVVFVSVPDIELADFLRAQRANSVRDWQDFVARYPSSRRAIDAEKSIAALHENAAEAAFAQYQRSGSAADRDLILLRQAYAEAQAAKLAFPGYEPSSKLTDAVEGDLDQLLQADRARLQAFQKALLDHSSGYSQLAAARVHLEQLLTVQPDYRPALDLRRDVAREERKLEGAVISAESLKASARYDDALNTLGQYSCLASEIPRIDAVVNAAYRYHFDRGEKFTEAQQWEQAVAEFRAAAAIRPENRQALAALNSATAQLNAQRDQEQAKLALAKSSDYASKGQYVEAYELLAGLPENQRALVTSQLSELKSSYVSAAMRRAQQTQAAHIPIRGRADEDSVREACDLLNRVSVLTSDPSITLRHDFLSSKLSAYYLDQANRYLQRPSGSGAGMGWLYLKEAERYGITNRDTVKDQMAKYAPLYQRRAQLSVGIVFRDQTSRQDGPSFTDQLGDAIANGLESSGAGVVVVRKPSDADDALQPNFLLVGEVLEHRVIKTEAVEAPQSKYRAATHEIKNPAWLQAQSDDDAARQQLAAAQQALADAQSQHKKKELIASASDAVQAAQKHADDAKQKLQAMDENLAQEVIETYHYTRKTVDLTASVELSFRITDRSGNVVGQPIDIHKENHKSATVVRDVKPEDTEGITNQNVEPDQAQFLTDLEIAARDAMVNAVRDRVSELPREFLQEARNGVQRGDLDEAAEQYLMYLNATPETAPARDEAVNFLHDRFNLVVAGASKL